MLRQLYSVRIFAVLFLFVLFGFSSFAQAQSTKEVLSNPQVGDIYVARLDHFSKVTFGRHGDKAFGLLRVTEVDDSRVIVITTTKGWSDSRAVTTVLNQGVKEVEWDTGEKIEILRADLPSFAENELVLDARRGGE